MIHYEYRAEGDRITLTCGKVEIQLPKGTKYELVNFDPEIDKEEAIKIWWRVDGELTRLIFQTPYPARKNEDYKGVIFPSGIVPKSIGITVPLGAEHFDFYVNNALEVSDTGQILFKPLTHWIVRIPDWAYLAVAVVLIAGAAAVILSRRQVRRAIALTGI